METNITLNKELLERIKEAPDGYLEKISSASTETIRTEIREEGFLRKIIPEKTVTSEDIDRVVEHDRPVIIEEIEAQSKGAMSVGFNTPTDTAMFYGPKGVIEFHQIKTPRYKKNIHELHTYRHDLKKSIVEKALNDIQVREDGSLIKSVNRLVGPENGVGRSGFRQNFVINGGITRSTYIEMKKKLGKLRLRNGVFLMNTTTAAEFEKFHHDEWGGPGAEDVWKKGLIGSINDAVLSGVRHIFTIKDELVPDNVVYCFTEPAFLGKFYILQDATMYVKKEEDILSMNATETIGLGILNVAGVIRTRFAGA